MELESNPGFFVFATKMLNTLRPRCHHFRVWVSKARPREHSHSLCKERKKKDKTPMLGRPLRTLPSCSSLLDFIGAYGGWGEEHSSASRTAWGSVRQEVLAVLSECSVWLRTSEKCWGFCFLATLSPGLIHQRCHFGYLTQSPALMAGKCLIPPLTISLHR